MNEGNRLVEAIVVRASQQEPVDDVTAQLIEAAFSPIGMLVAAIIGGVITLVSVRMQHRGSPEREFIDRIQKQMNDDMGRNEKLTARLDAQDVKLEAYRAKLEAQGNRIDELEDAQEHSARIEVLLRAHIVALGAHIESGNPPPAPEPPAGLTL